MMQPTGQPMPPTMQPGGQPAMGQPMGQPGAQAPITQRLSPEEIQELKMFVTPRFVELCAKAFGPEIIPFLEPYIQDDLMQQEQMAGGQPGMGMGMDMGGGMPGPSMGGGGVRNLFPRG